MAADYKENKANKGLKCKAMSPKNRMDMYRRCHEAWEMTKKGGTLHVCAFDKFGYADDAEHKFHGDFYREFVVDEKDTDDDADGV